ncbi:MAG: cell division protein FtsQ [Prevotella sp.]
MTFNWKSTLFVIIDIVIVVYLMFAVTAFNEPDDGHVTCSQVDINITDDIVDGFLTSGEIKKILERNQLYPIGRTMKDISARQIEETLKNSPFVDKVQCHKTPNGHVCITLTQRMPLIRVKADNGDDYYIDSRGGVMPNTKYTTDLIIATGKISRQYATKVLMTVGNCIVKDKFWQNQIVQLNVLDDGTLEAVPRVGDHIIYFGPPNHIERKLDRLEKFYKYGLNQAGWNKYSYINLEFDNQIICKKRQLANKH